MPFVLAVDYDDTLFENAFPEKGDPKDDIINKVKEFQDNGAEIVLWTCREGEKLQDAVDACSEQGLKFDAVNANAPSVIAYMEDKEDIFAQHKINADFYVDDKAYNLDFFLNINVKETCRRFSNR